MLSLVLFTAAIPPCAQDVEQSVILLLVTNKTFIFSDSDKATLKPAIPDPMIKTSVFIRILIYNKIAFIDIDCIQQVEIM